MTEQIKRRDEGIEVRHKKRCRITGNPAAKCSCDPSYRAEVYDRARGGRIHKSFPTKAAAKSWRASMQTRIRNGEAGIIDSPRLSDAWTSWYHSASHGVILNNKGILYKPSVLRGYEQSMRLHVLPVLGGLKLVEIRVPHVQALVDKLVAKGLAARSVRNHVAPLQVVYKDAIRRELARFNPAVGLALPSGEQVRDRIATPAEAVTLLAALSQDRALWATAFYAGLRAGELMALDWSCVDLEAQVITVERSYDPKAHEFVAPKSKKGLRKVPYPDLLQPFLVAEDRTRGLVFGPDGHTPFVATTVRKRALMAWGWNPLVSPAVPRVVEGAELATMQPITLHECRHTYASHMLAAEVDIVKVSKWMGHSSIQITVDRYGHLVPGDERDAMAQYGAYLTKPVWS